MYRPEQRLDQPSVGAEDLGRPVAAQAAQQHLEAVEQRLQRQVASHRIAPPGQHGSAPVQAGQERIEQRGLADARLADHHYCAIGCAGLQQPVQLGQFIIPAGHFP